MKASYTVQQTCAGFAVIEEGKPRRCVREFTLSGDGDFTREEQYENARAAAVELCDELNNNSL